VVTVKYCDINKVSNEFGLFHLIYLLERCVLKRDLVYIDLKVDIVETLTHCITRGIYLHLVRNAITVLTNFGRVLEFDLTLPSVKTYLHNYYKKKDILDDEL
jgi:hypothetical protein